MPIKYIAKTEFISNIESTKDILFLKTNKLFGYGEDDIAFFRTEEEAKNAALTTTQPNGIHIFSIESVFIPN